MPDNYPKQQLQSWDVKPIWRVSPSIEWGDSEDFSSFIVWGVSRANPNVVRPVIPIHDLAQYNQEFADGIPEYYFSIFVKEVGRSFEVMRRLSTSGIQFKIEGLMVTDLEIKSIVENLVPFSDAIINTGAINVLLARRTKGWMNGYEELDGCKVIEETTNYEVATFPLREFKIRALRRKVMSGFYDEGDENQYHIEIEEGDGNYVREL